MSVTCYVTARQNCCQHNTTVPPLGGESEHPPPDPGRGYRRDRPGEAGGRPREPCHSVTQCDQLNRNERISSWRVSGGVGDAPPYPAAAAARQASGPVGGRIVNTDPDCVHSSAVFIGNICDVGGGSSDGLVTDTRTNTAHSVYCWSPQDLRDY